MKLKEYIKQCKKTWGKGNEDKRIVIGIEEEFGGLAGKIKRWYRGDYENDKKKFNDDLQAEIGDCLYYVAMAIDRFDGNIDFVLDDSNVKPDDIFASWFSLNVCKNLYILDKKYVELFTTLICFANSQSFKIKDIIKYNIKKLEDRQKRGVIKGNGDNR